MRKMSGNEKITVESMNLHYGKFHALKNINMAIPEKEITAFIGPSAVSYTHLDVYKRQLYNGVGRGCNRFT